MFNMMGFFGEKEVTNRVFMRKFRKSHGNRGIDETIGAMIEMKDHYKQDVNIRTFVLKNLVVDDSISGDRNIINARQIFNMILKHVDYCPDILDVETLQTPMYTWKYGKGDCDDYSILGATFLETVGIPTHFVIVGRGKDYTHVYLYFEDLRGINHPFDLTRKRFDFEDKRYTIKKVY